MADSAVVLGQTQAQILDRVQDIRWRSSLVVIAHRVGFQAVCLHNVEYRLSELVCRRGRFGCTDSRSVDMGVIDAVAVAGVAVVIAVVVVVAGSAPCDLRHDRLDRIASTFFVVSYQKTTQNDLKSFALSE